MFYVITDNQNLSIMRNKTVKVYVKNRANRYVFFEI